MDIVGFWRLSAYFSIHREKPQDDEWLALRDQKLPLLLNYSQCKLLMEDYYIVIEHCTEALEIDPGRMMMPPPSCSPRACAHGSSLFSLFNVFFFFSILDNVKALYRRARAHHGAWNPSNAKEDYFRVIALDQKLENTCKKELKKLEDSEKLKDKEDMEKMKKLF